MFVTFSILPLHQREGEEKQIISATVSVHVLQEVAQTIVEWYKKGKMTKD